MFYLHGERYFENHGGHWKNTGFISKLIERWWNEIDLLHVYIEFCKEKKYFTLSTDSDNILLTLSRTVV